MESGEKALIYLAAGFAGGIALFVYGFMLRQRRKTIESIPTSKVRSLAMGPVELQGRASICGAPLISPFAGSRCVYYRYHVEEFVRRGKHSHWVTLTKADSPNRFYLEDETGKVLVDPRGADLHLEKDRQYSGGSIAGLTGVFDQLGIRWQGAFGFTKSLRVSETVVEPGDPVFVIGTASLTRAGRPEDAAEEEALVGRGADHYFCISDKSEKELLASFGLKMYACLYGGPALTIGCLYLLLAYFGRI